MTLEDYEEFCKNYLIQSWLYYEKDVSVVSDNMYDTNCYILHRDYSKLPEWFRERVSRDSLRAGTGFNVKLTKEEQEEALEIFEKHGEWNLPY